jgi:hypothetical protein
MHAKARHHFIEDQHGAITIADRAQPGQEARARHDEVHVAGDGLDDDAGDARAVGLECGLDRIKIVVGKHEGLAGDRRGHAGRRRLAESQRTGARLYEQAVAVAVITTCEFDDGAAPGKAAGEPERDIVASVPDDTSRTSSIDGSGGGRLRHRLRLRSARRTTTVRGRIDDGTDDVGMCVSRIAGPTTRRSRYALRRRPQIRALAARVSAASADRAERAYRQLTPPEWCAARGQSSSLRLRRNHNGLPQRRRSGAFVALTRRAILRGFHCARIARRRDPPMTQQSPCSLVADGQRRHVSATLRCSSAACAGSRSRSARHARTAWCGASRSRSSTTARTPRSPTR